LHRDGFRCGYCGASPLIAADIELQLDHVVPESRGGESTAGNLMTSCRQCNAEKYTYQMESTKVAEILEIIELRNKANGIKPESKIASATKYTREDR
jgi:hypothetical protein